MEEESDEIPERAILLLAKVRESGETNMWMSSAVLALAHDYADDAEDFAALDWLMEGHRRHGNSHYVAALKALGEARAAGRIP